MLPLLVTAGIDASREHTDKGTVIALRRVLRSNVSDVREEESGGEKAKTADNTDGLMSGRMSAKNPLIKRPLTLLTTLTLDMRTLGKAAPCATTAGEERHERYSEVEVPTLF